MDAWRATCTRAYLRLGAEPEVVGGGAGHGAASSVGPGGGAGAKAGEGSGGQEARHAVVAWAATR